MSKVTRVSRSQAGLLPIWVVCYGLKYSVPHDQEPNGYFGFGSVEFLVFGFCVQTDLRRAGEKMTSKGIRFIETWCLFYTTGEPAFAMCPAVCCEQHTVKVGFVMCAHAYCKRHAHGILGLCRVLHTANTRHTANSNVCRKQHTAKTGHTTKANPY